MRDGFRDEGWIWDSGRDLGMRNGFGIPRLIPLFLPPSPCPCCSQLAYGQDGQLKGFAVLEFESPEAAERVQRETDGIPLAGNHIRVSFCAPGPPGRSMLAALIAAQVTVSPSSSSSSFPSSSSSRHSQPRPSRLEPPATFPAAFAIRSSRFWAVLTQKSARIPAGRQKFPQKSARIPAGRQKFPLFSGVPCGIPGGNGGCWQNSARRFWNPGELWLCRGFPLWFFGSWDQNSKFPVFSF